MMLCSIIVYYQIAKEQGRQSHEAKRSLASPPQKKRNWWTCPRKTEKENGGSARIISTRNEHLRMRSACKDNNYMKTLNTGSYSLPLNRKDIISLRSLVELIIVMHWQVFTWHGHMAVLSQEIQDRLGAKSGWLACSAGWLTGWLCSQPRFQFHEVKAAGWYTERIVNEAPRRSSFPSRSAKTIKSGERWMDGIPMF